MKFIVHKLYQPYNNCHETDRVQFKQIKLIKINRDIHNQVQQFGEL